MIVLDAQARIADINPAAERLLSISAAQAIGQPIAEVLQAWPQALDRFSSILETVDEITLGSGEAQRWYDVRVSPLKDRRQQVAGRVVTVRNITERKQVEERLLEERNLLRTVIDNVPDQIFVRDLNSRFVLSNLSDARMMGVDDPETLVGKTDYDFYPPALAAEFQLDNQAVLASGQAIINREERSRNADGEPRWTLTTKVPLRDPQGRLTGLVGIARDITERKRAAELTKSFLDDMKALQQIYLTLSAISDLDTLYTSMIALAQRRLHFDRVGLFLIDHAANQLQGTFGVDPSGQPRDERYYRETITPDHWTLEVLNAPDRALVWDDAPLFDNGQQVGTGWKAAATLWNGHAAVGYLMVDNYLTKKPARAYEAELISLLGSTFGHLIERLRADEQIRELSRAVEASPTSIVITDTRGTIQYVNPKFTEVTGYTFAGSVRTEPAHSQN